MRYDFGNILLLFLVFQLLLISFLVYTKKTQARRSNSLLALFLLLLGLSLLDQFLLLSGWYFQYPFWANWSVAFPLAYGPLLWLYSQRAVGLRGALQQRDTLHFLPFVLLSLIAAATYMARSTPAKIKILVAISTQAISPNLYLVALLLIIHFLFYELRAVKLLREYTSRALNQLSNPERVNINWLRSTLFLFLFIFLLAFAANVFQFCHLVILRECALLLIIVALLVFVNNIIFKAFQQPDLFSWTEPAEVAAEIGKITTFSTEVAEAAEALAMYMQVNEPYTNPNLSVELLAGELKMRPKELSQLINSYYQQNFFDYVNRYRIDAAKKILLNSTDPKLTVLEVLYTVGFNSKSSFNTLFKKYTGITPTEFKTQTKRVVL